MMCSNTDVRFWIYWWNIIISCYNEKDLILDPRVSFQHQSRDVVKICGTTNEAFYLLWPFSFSSSIDRMKNVCITGGVPNSISFLRSLHTSIREYFLWYYSNRDLCYIKISATLSGFSSIYYICWTFWHFVDLQMYVDENTATKLFTYYSINLFSYLFLLSRSKHKMISLSYNCMESYFWREW